jgi:hypothetical protein
MFINLGAGTATLEDIDNFKIFRVTTSLARTERQQALTAIGRPDGAYIWIDAAWLAGFAKMLDYAKDAGWVDGTGAIRAHIEN